MLEKLALRGSHVLNRTPSLPITLYNNKVFVLFQLGITPDQKSCLDLWQVDLARLNLNAAPSVSCFYALPVVVLDKTNQKLIVVVFEIASVQLLSPQFSILHSLRFVWQSCIKCIRHQHS